MATKRTQAVKDVKRTVNKTVDTLDNQSHIASNILRRAVLAYLGMYGVAYDEAQSRVKAFRENRKDWFDRLVEKGEEMEVQASELMEDAQARVEENTAKLREALSLDSNVVELKVKTKKPAAKKTTAKKTTAKKITAKKTVVKKAAAKKRTAKKPVTKKPVAKKTTTKKTPVKTTTPKVSGKKAPVTTPARKETTQAALELTPAPVTTVATDAPRHIAYLEDIRRYDAKASETVVKKIVNHCGIALSNNDGKFVSCSDESERQTVRDSWMKKKLRIEGTDEALDKKVLDVCEQMKGDRMKNRVTFYYLVAKNDGALIFI